MNDAPNRTTLFRIHLISLFFGMLTAALLLYGNVVLANHADSLDCDIHNNTQFADNVRQFGWPLVACYTYTQKEHVCLGKLNGGLLTMDLIFNFSILAIVIIPLEWAERRRPWLRWHVSAGIVLFAAMEILLSNDRQFQDLCAISIIAAPILASNLITGVLVARSNDDRRSLC